MGLFLFSIHSNIECIALLGYFEQQFIQIHDNSLECWICFGVHKVRVDEMMIYKVTSIKKYKPINMKWSMVISLLFFFFLIMPSVKASLLNITSPLTIYEDNDWVSVPNPYVYSHDIVFDPSINKWFIGTLHTNEYSYAIFDSNMTTNILGWKTYPDSYPLGGSKLLDYNTTHLVLHTYQMPLTNKMTLNKTYISKEDLSTTEDRSMPYYNKIISDSSLMYKNIGVAEDDVILTVNATTGTYMKLQFIEPDSNTIFNASYCPLCSLGNITDLNLFKVNEEYWVIVRAYRFSSLNWTTCQKIYLARFVKDGNHYDTVSGTSYTQLSTGCVLDPLASYPASLGTNSFSGSLATKRIGNYIYFASREAEPPTEINNTMYFRVLSINDFLATGQPALAEERYNLEDYDTNLNISMITVGLGIGYNPIMQNWVLLYQKFKNNGILSSGATRYHAYALKSYESCLCNAWTNISSCGKEIPTKQKQVRTCLPENCDTTVRYIDCTEIPPQIYYKNETYYSTCQVSPVDPRLTYKIGCALSVAIPENCTNINSTAFLYTYLDKNALSCKTGNTFVKKICNPLDQPCQYQSFTCGDEGNATSYEKVYEGYQAGDVATSNIEISGIGACSGNMGFLECGWDTVGVTGVLSITCNIVCGGYNVCYKSGQFWYSVQELPNCMPNTTQFTEEHICYQGCDQEMGICIEDIVTTTVDIGTTPTGNPFAWIVDRAKNTFPSVVLYGFSIFTSLGIAIYTQQATGKTDMSIALISFLGMIVFFSMIGWLPTWIGIIITLGIILMLSQKIWRR